MNTVTSISYMLTLALILFGVGTRNVFAEEQCQQMKENRLADQDFGMALTADDLLTSMMSPFMFRDYFRPWKYLTTLSRDLGSTIKTDKDKFQINLDVQHFSPEEITVKTADGYIIVEGKHEEKKDEHGFVTRQFQRRYYLPEGTEPESVISQLSSDGILTITAPRKEIVEKGERVVPITQTGPARKESKDDNKEQSCQKSEL